MRQTSILHPLRLNIVVKLSHDVFLVGVLSLVVDARTADNIAAAEHTEHALDDPEWQSKQGREELSHISNTCGGQHGGGTTILNVSLEIENVVHQISNTVSNDQGNPKSGEIAINDVEIWDSHSLDTRVDPVENLVVLAANLDRSGTNYMLEDVLLVDHNQSLAGLNSVLDHVLDAQLVLAPCLAIQELLELVSIIAVEVVALDALRVLVIIVDGRVVIVYRILICLSSREWNHSWLSRHWSWQVRLSLWIEVTFCRLVRKGGRHLLLDYKKVSTCIIENERS